jgi:hypothetical protein
MGLMTSLRRRVVLLAADFFFAEDLLFVADFFFTATLFGAVFLDDFFLAEAAFLAADFFRVGFFLLTVFFLRADFFLAMGKVYQNARSILTPSRFCLPPCSFVSSVVKGLDFSILAIPAILAISLKRWFPQLPPAAWARARPVPESFRYRRCGWSR